MQHTLKDGYTAVINRIIALQHHDRYEGAFVFGSYATDDLQEASDLDVVVLVTDEESCPEVSHPRVGGIPVDISFNSFARIQHYIHQTLAQGFRRKPWLYDSQILFDKKGRLRELAEWTRENAIPTAYTEADYDDMQMTAYYYLMKAARFLKTEPEVALLVMQTNLDDLLRRHYKIHARWRVADKKILSDLAIWHPVMHKALRQFLTTPTVDGKYAALEEMVDIVLAPIGGRNFTKYADTCHCAQCQIDLQLLTAQN